MNARHLLCAAPLTLALLPACSETKELPGPVTYQAVDAGTDEPAPAAATTAVSGLTLTGDRLCLLAANGKVTCALFEGETATLGAFAEVEGLSDVVELAGGGAHLCARTTDGDVYCLGANDRGQLGVDAPNASERPLRVELPGKARAVAAGENHACALLEGDAPTEATAFCWGDNTAGQVGRSGRDRYTPTPAALSPEIGEVDATSPRGRSVRLAASGTSTCAVFERASVDAPDTVLCWGRGGFGFREWRPWEGEAVENLAVGGAHTCARSLAGQVSCQGTTEVDPAVGGTLAEPLNGQPFGDEPVAALALGAAHTCALTADALLLCAGAAVVTPESGAFGELGGLVSLASAGERTCVLSRDGRMACLRFDPAAPSDGGPVGLTLPAALGPPPTPVGGPLALPSAVAAGFAGLPDTDGGVEADQGGGGQWANGAQCAELCNAFTQCGFPPQDDNGNPLDLQGCIDLCTRQIPASVYDCYQQNPDCAGFMSCLQPG